MFRLRNLAGQAQKKAVLQPHGPDGSSVNLPSLSIDGNDDTE